MNIFKTILLGAIVAAPMMGVAQAADNNAYVPSDVATASGFYLRGDAGGSYLAWNAPANVFGYSGSAGVGYQASDFLRMDVTGEWTGGYTIAPGSSLSTTAVMGNIYFDWKNESPLTPYVGAGLGYGWTNITGVGAFNDSGLAYGLNAGVAVDISSNMALDVGYHYRNIASAGADPVEHTVTAGLRFKF